MPLLDERGLRACQVEAVEGLEASLAKARPRALIQMATGAGKTFTACTFGYRLLKFADARRILFLVDRNNPGEQTLREFQQYRPPDDGRSFTDLYVTQQLKSPRLDGNASVVITTIQRLYRQPTKTPARGRGSSSMVSVVAGAGFEPAAFRL